MFVTSIILSYCSDDLVGRRKLQLLPRTVKDPVASLADQVSQASIFGEGKPRDEKQYSQGKPRDESHQVVEKDSNDSVTKTQSRDPDTSEATKDRHNPSDSA